MRWDGLVWVVGCVLLLAAGFGSTLLPRVRARRRYRRVAWSTARAAIASATVSRDAAPTTLTQAEQLLSRAELLAASGGGPAAARSATRYARRADRLWQEATSA